MITLGDLLGQSIDPDSDQGRKLAAIHALEHEIASAEIAILTGPLGPLYCTCQPYRGELRQPDPTACTYHRAVIAEHLHPSAERRCGHGHR